MRWSNHPRARGDGVMLPCARGVILTDDGAEVMFDLTGRTVFAEQPSGGKAGRQLLMTLFESDGRVLSLAERQRLYDGGEDRPGMPRHAHGSLVLPRGPALNADHSARETPLCGESAPDTSHVATYRFAVSLLRCPLRKQGGSVSTTRGSTARSAAVLGRRHRAAHLR